MAISLTHPFVSAIADGADTTLVQPSDWNDQHTLTLAASRLLGRATGSAGAAEEIPLGTGLSFSAGSLVFATAAIGTWIATPSSANLAAAVTDETGTGALVFANTPTLVTPILGTPTSGTLTNCTGLPVAGITASTTTALGVGSIELGHASDTTISRASAGVIAVEGVNVITTANISDTAFAASWDGVTTVAPSKNAVYDQFQNLAPTPTTTSWVVASPSNEPIAGSSGPGANTIRYTAIWIPRAVTISDLGARVTTGVGASNSALAIYANAVNGGLNQPSGTPLAATGDISTASAANVSADITGSNVTLEAGLYWAAVWCSAAGIIFMRNGGVDTVSQLVGHTTLNLVVQAATDAGYIYESSETFNSAAWPNATTETLTLAASNRNFVLFYKVV